MKSIKYIVRQINGDYAYLRNQESQDEELKCVARAMLPEEIYEGAEIVYENLEYYMAD